MSSRIEQIVTTPSSTSNSANISTQSNSSNSNSDLDLFFDLTEQSVQSVRMEEEDDEEEEEEESGEGEESDFLDLDDNNRNGSKSSSRNSLNNIKTPATPKKSNLRNHIHPWPFHSEQEQEELEQQQQLESIPTLNSPTLTISNQPLPLAPTPPIPASSLPHEILLHILRLLPSSSLSPALLVCKAWCQCGVELLWHKPNFNSIITLNKMLKVIDTTSTTTTRSKGEEEGRGEEREQQTFPYSIFIKRLNFSNLSEELNDLILLKLLNCFKLERLTLSNCNKLSSKNLLKFFENFSSPPSSLSSLSPSNINNRLSISSSNGNNLTNNLIALDLTEIKSVNDELLLILAKNCKKLQGLNLSGCNQVTDKGLEAIALNCPAIRRVSFSFLFSFLLSKKKLIFSSSTNC